MADPYAAAFGLLRRFRLLDPIARMATWRVQGQDERALATEEFRAKLGLMATVLTIEVPDNVPLAQTVDDALPRRADYMPFILEGIASKYFTRHPDHSFAQEGLAERACPTQLSMLHIGAGMALARRHLARPQGVAPFLAACDHIAVPGYRGCLIEPAGLVAMLDFGGPAILKQWDLDADSRAWAYHGLGRGLVFGPRAMRPGRDIRDRPLRDLDELLATLDDPIAIANLVAGCFWALSAVSLERPWLLADTLVRIEDKHPRLRVHEAAIVGGICTNLYMLHCAHATEDAAGAKPNPRDFFAYRPSLDRQPEVWDRMVVAPFEDFKAKTDQQIGLKIESIYRV